MARKNSKMIDQDALVEQEALTAEINDLRQQKARIENAIRKATKALGASIELHGDAIAATRAAERRQAWLDGEPLRAADRETPEWQAWHDQFMAEQRTFSAWLRNPDRRDEDRPAITSLTLASA